MKIALVHDYLTQQGGAERVFELLCQRYPNADIFTSLYEPRSTIDLGDRPVHTTYLQQLPQAAKYFKLLAPFYLQAFQTLDLRAYDLILSSSSSFAKGVRKRSDAKHICFCHNTPRFLWDTKTYFRQSRTYQWFHPLLERSFHALRQADLICAQEPDLYIANSQTVAQRIAKTYGQKALVLHYPINRQKFSFCDRKQNFYLTCTRLLSYKRVDVIVEAFNWLGWPLRVIGDGPQRRALQSRALKNVEFLGHVSDADRQQLMADAQSVVVSALEDYGLVPIEANISGTPVIAYGAGGVLETQIPGQTGLFFSAQTPDALHQTLLKARTIAWDYQKIHQHALSRFSEEQFFQSVDRVIDNFCGAVL